MRRIFNIHTIWFALLLIGLNHGPLNGAEAAQSDSLPSWNEGVAKKAIIDFVARDEARLAGFRAAGGTHRYFR